MAAGSESAGRPAAAPPRRERGSAAVDGVAPTAAIALLALAAVAALAAEGQIESSRPLAAAIAKKIRCAPRLPGPCRRHPLVTAYGWPLARLARALAPHPAARIGRSGLPLVPVDFRRCRRESCAVYVGSPRLTASNRRLTLFTQLLDRRAELGWVTVVYWLYRPGLGWERAVREATAADVEAAAGVRVLFKDDPALVPLETLPGRNHYEFPAAERPPWRWRVRARHPGWSS